MIHELAAALGGTIVRPHPGNPSLEYIEMPSGYWLWIGCKDIKGKVHIHMERTSHPALREISRYAYDPGNLNTIIGVSSAKPIAAIAADIKRRLLPNCEALWILAKQCRINADVANDKAASMLAQLNQVCPGFADPLNDRPEERQFRGKHRRVNSGLVRTSDNEVDMQLTQIPLASALEIAAIVAKLKGTYS